MPADQSAQAHAGHPTTRAPDPAALLQEGREHDRFGRMSEAVDCYSEAASEARRAGSDDLLAEALRRLAVVHHRQNRPVEARGLAQRSYHVALAIGDQRLAAEALNALGGFDFENGAVSSARDTFRRALAMAGAVPSLRGRIEQNLGILANIQGDLPGALAHYRRSLEAFECAQDERGCALAYHNLGMISADRELWSDAEHYFEQSQAIADRIGDVHLRGLCLLNRSEVYLATRRFEQARESAGEALHLFDQLGAALDKADAYMALGTVFREMGCLALAESRLRTARELAVETGSVLSQAETSRELARLYQRMGRNQEALRELNRAYRLFNQLDAQLDLHRIADKVAELEGTYREIVRTWGESFEMADGYSAGECERVATYAVAVARELGLDANRQTAVRFGAYLHDVGKASVPHEILCKPAPLTRPELEVIQRHPALGVELLVAADFPLDIWDVVPMIRWHHERYDGSGYPDRLRGDEVPLEAQIIGLVDVYDALTTRRSYRAAMTHEQALAELHASRHWWRPDVFEAFMRSVGGALDAPPGKP